MLPYRQMLEFNEKVENNFLEKRGMQKDYISRLHQS